MSRTEQHAFFSRIISKYKNNHPNDFSLFFFVINFLLNYYKTINSVNNKNDF